MPRKKSSSTKKTSENETQSFSAGQLWEMLKKEPLYWLLLAIPVAFLLKILDAVGAGANGAWMFLVACIAIIPLAGLMGRATENLAETFGAGIGGLLNATFGNAAELIIALLALARGPELYPLVKASLTGSIIGNILLVLGLSLLAGGYFHQRLKFNATAAGMGATLLALAGVGLLIPSLYQFAAPTPLEGDQPIATLSEEIAVILAITYGLSLFFSLKTHQHLFAGDEEHLPTTGEHHEPEWNRTTALTILIVATVGVAIMSEFLIGSVEVACESLGMSTVFVGVIVVAVIGNAAEHSTAILVAMKNKMDLAINIAIGSGIQIALFVAPMLVFASVLMGHEEVLDLHFTMMELIAVVISIVILAMVCHDGESHWMEGVMLLAVYLMLALAFFHLPVAESHTLGH